MAHVEINLLYEYRSSSFPFFAPLQPTVTQPLQLQIDTARHFILLSACSTLVVWSLSAGGVLRVGRTRYQQRGHSKQRRLPFRSTPPLAGLPGRRRVERTI